ncbi:hypothetical protein [Leptospira sp. GIMC2001]|uniref:hypothetical protein n=1 Tax=Leptospira sp. GIMC2001 TaxID=1513297 RepID=UPI00234A5DC0|nr:hypothetical protein [Leptospira sp. GIMC2001]WCL49989.1 hypothetical protein O4O04_03995 [Leptospira sp. GIMC2001]
MKPFIFIALILNFAIISNLSADAKYIGKKPKEYLENYELPRTPSLVYEDLMKIKHPDDFSFQLKLDKNSGSTIGPDGGEVQIWGKGSYTWNLKNRNKFTRWNENQWELKTPTHTFRSNKGGHSVWTAIIYIVYPDSSCIFKNSIPNTDVFQFTYDKPCYQAIVSQDGYTYSKEMILEPKEKPGLHYDIVHPTFWGTNRTQIGSYDITYSDNWQPYIDVLSKWNRLDPFLDYIKKEFGYESPRIKAVLHESKEKFWIYSNKSPNNKESCTGWSLKTMFTLCPDAFQIFSKTKDTAVFQAQLESAQFKGLLHDTVHYTQANRCENLRIDNVAKFTSPWFVEGIAELAIFQTNPKMRSEAYRLFFDKYLDSKPSLSKANDPNFQDYRLIGLMFLNYLSHQFGNKSIQKFYDLTCYNLSQNTAFTKAFGTSIDSEFKRMYEYYNSQKSSIESNLYSWSLFSNSKTDYIGNIDDGKGCKLIDPEMMNELKIWNSPSHKNISSSDLSEKFYKYDDSPCILGAYNFDFEKLAGKYEGYFTGELPKLGYQKVFLSKNNYYSILGEEFTVHIGEDEVQWEMGKLRIINWKSKPDRQIQFPSGWKIHCWNRESGCSKPFK